MSRPRLVAAVAAGAVLAVAATGFVVVRHRLDGRCGRDVHLVPAASAQDPFLGAAGRRDQPDAHRDTLVRAAGRWASPFAGVAGALGYDYQQDAHVLGLAQGIGVRTRDNPDLTVLDDHTLRPRWGVQVDTARSAYDFDDQVYDAIALPAGRPPEVTSVNAATGAERWCARLGDRPVGADDPLSTYVPGDHGLVALTPASGGRPGSSSLRLTRLAADGTVRWARATSSAARGDYLGSVGSGTLLAGGVEQFRLVDPTFVASQRGGPVVESLSAATGAPGWTWRTPARTAVHVVGVDEGAGRVVLVQTTARGSARLLALDTAGHRVWAVPVPSVDAALRSGRVLVRGRAALTAYDVTTGRRAWQRPVPQSPQFFPYGYTLDSAPLLDVDRLLLGTTAALRVLDVRSGAMRSYPLPTDGINTTYWPYELAVSPGAIAVATNTGAVVLHRG